MNLMKPKGSKKERKQFSNEGVLESLGGILTASVDHAKQNVDGGTHDAWNQLLLQTTEGTHNKGNNSHEGDLSEGAELDLAHLSEKAHEITEQGREYVSEIVHAGKRADSEQSQEIQIKMQEIIIEIKQLSNSSAQLQKQVEVMSMEQVGEKPGVYHLNFLEQMLSFIHDLRLNVEDSLAWFGALRSKKAARSYQSMAKKHGTSFTLGNERQVATQVG